MDLATLLATINTQHTTQFTLLGKYAAGENHGGYAVRDARQGNV